jgi:RNA polymerase sigma-B factor
MTDSVKSKPLTRRTLQQRNQRVSQYCTLVNPIAVHYCRRCPEPLDDLVQVGLMGLLRAAELYRPQTTTPFDAFARPHIRGAILHYLRDSALAVRLPRRQMELHDKLRKLKASWSSCHRQEPSAEDLRLALGLSPDQWQDLLRGQAMARPMDLETRVDGTLLHEVINSKTWEADSPALGDWEKVVLSGWTYRRTAALLQVSPMTVQRRLKQGLAQLRSAINAGGAKAISRQQCRHPAPSVVPAC